MRSSKRQKKDLPNKEVKQAVEVRVGSSARAVSTQAGSSGKPKRGQATDAQDDTADAHRIQSTPALGKSTRKQKAPENGELRTEKPSALFKPTKGRDWTVSIAVPGSFLHNAKDKELKSAVCGQIARAAAVFCVDEIVVFDDDPNHFRKKPIDPKKKAALLEKIEPKDQDTQDPDMFLYTLLMYMECPPHLRKILFKFDPRFQWQGIFPSLDMPHHTKPDEWSQFREGVSLDLEIAQRDPKHYAKAIAELRNPTSETPFTLVECGFKTPLRIAVEIPGGMRVTLRFPDAKPPRSWPHLTPGDLAYLEENVETPHVDQPRLEGYYWGYNVRKVSSLSAVWTESDYESGYDFSIGTSERGIPLSSVLPDPDKPIVEGMLPEKFEHMIIFFGGVSGLEPIVAADPELGVQLTKETAHEAFDSWVNVLPGQGSRTIRMEEAVWISLMGLRPYIASCME
ncbi:DUF171-domain-containing protein [Amniculicola lignicola CBS 123094]|uniref:DUF171-domain-containing protein n=1 Tax=Amniculicola lignicola CBS 123094 TaxID=1392246 RepID=A0A6A5WIL2_9PLEO|nr:DUF171-domain-containing protein [Amniculicola lignicola CBS 123094]